MNDKKRGTTPVHATEWVDEELHGRIRKFLGDNRVQTVSFREFCSGWDWARRSDVFTHMIHTYPGKLLPHVPLFFLASSMVQDGETILDPFAGTGTVLLESMVNRFKALHAWGAEINPLARLIASTKTTPISVDRLKGIREDLVTALRRPYKRTQIPEFNNRDFWFRGKAQRELAQIKHVVDGLLLSDRERDFLWVCVSSIIRDLSRADPDIGPPVIFNPGNFPMGRCEEMKSALDRKRRLDGFSLFLQTVDKNIERICSLVEEVGLDPVSVGQIIWDDARTTKKGHYLHCGSIDKKNARPITGKVAMVITSPPYMAAQKYIRTTRLELLWLGLASYEDVAELERSSIGTERVSKTNGKLIVPTGCSLADNLVRAVQKINPVRASIAAKYFADMKEVLRSIHGALKPKGTCILVLGNNNVSGHISPNHRILSNMAAGEGWFTTKLIMKDPIRARGMITKRHETGGIIPEEYVIIMEKTN
jgi:hypothetical protein